MKTWFNCPSCHKKICMIETSKNIEGVYCQCPKCKREVEILNITELRGQNPVPGWRSEVRTQKPVSEIGLYPVRWLAFLFCWKEDKDLQEKMTLKDLCKTKGYTLSRLSEETDISMDYLSKMNTGKRNNPTSDIIGKISGVLNITADEVIKAIRN